MTWVFHIHHDPSTKTTPVAEQRWGIFAARSMYAEEVALTLQALAGYNLGNPTVPSPAIWKEQWYGHGQHVFFFCHKIMGILMGMGM